MSTGQIDQLIEIDKGTSVVFKREMGHSRKVIKIYAAAVYISYTEISNSPVPPGCKSRIYIVKLKV